MIGPCWEWPGARAVAGYGVTKRDGRQMYVHRLVWEIANARSLPVDRVVMHRCDNPPCVNPEHLLLGTHADNNGDRSAKGRSCHGPRHPNAKLSSEQVAEIRRRADGGWTTRELGEEYGVAQTTISRIVRLERRVRS